MPFNVVINTIIALKDAFLTVLSFFGLAKRRTRRNRDFDRAGRESSNVSSVDSTSAANLNNADRLRDLEILAQVRYENRMLRKNSEEAENLRKAMIEDSLSVSQGAAINHLAEVNRRAKEKEKRERERKQQEQDSAEQNQNDQ